MASKVNLDVSEKLDITCRKGDTFKLQLTLKDSTGTALTLTTSGYEFLMQVRGRQKSQGSRKLLIGSTNRGKAADEGVNFTFTKTDSGVLTVTASDAIMRKVQPGRYVYDLQQILDGVTTTILKGNFTVNDDISEALA
jgi:hypothetical protein